MNKNGTTDSLFKPATNTQQKGHDNLYYLGQVQKAINDYILPQDIKHCVALMFVIPSAHSRRNTLLILASELRRLGLNKTEIRKRVNPWNEKLLDSYISESEINRTIGSAFKKDYGFGCDKNKIIKSFCKHLDRAQCIFYQNRNVYKRPRKEMYKSLGYHKILSHTASAIYLIGLVDMEKKRNMFPGSRLFTSYRELAEESCIAISSVSKGLKELQNSKLIFYKPGQRGSLSRSASEIRRIFPVPKIE